MREEQLRCLRAFGLIRYSGNDENKASGGAERLLLSAGT